MARRERSINASATEHSRTLAEKRKTSSTNGLYVRWENGQCLDETRSPNVFSVGVVQPYPYFLPHLLFCPRIVIDA